ncbi:MAG TPA: hypothetical protein VG096_02885 [Bryobacteraceae bacterium]|jgi:hypothetical protein|nr:hypothetical protein [Bryobacteraceae bacterium]
MIPHIIAIAPSIREARENFEFFAQLSSSPHRNVDAIIALAVKFIDLDSVIQNAQIARTN